MMYRLFIGLILLTELASAQLPVAAGHFPALGTDAPFGSSFQSRSFPQAGPGQDRLSLAVGVLQYPDLPEFGSRFLAANFRQSTYHWSVNYESSGDALFRYSMLRLHTGMQLNGWRIGCGLRQQRISIEAQHDRQWLAVAGLSAQINKAWSLHASLQGQAPFQSEPALVETGNMQAQLMLVHQHHKTQLVGLLSHHQMLGADVGAGLRHQLHKDIEVDWACSFIHKRMSFGFQYKYHHFLLRLSVMQQQLPGLWWLSTADWQIPAA